MNARSFNGPEEAQDYLWLSQDMWMEPDVWNWANDDPIAKTSILRTCCRPFCGKEETKANEFKRCAGCKTVRLLDFLVLRSTAC